MKVYSTVACSFLNILYSISSYPSPTVKTGLFSITVPQTGPLHITVLSSKYLGKVVFVNWHKFICVITQTPFYRIRTQTLLVQHSRMLKCSRRILRRIELLGEAGFCCQPVCVLRWGEKIAILCAAVVWWVERGIVVQEVVGSYPI